MERQDFPVLGKTIHCQEEDRVSAKFCAEASDSSLGRRILASQGPVQASWPLGWCHPAEVSRRTTVSYGRARNCRLHRQDQKDERSVRYCEHWLDNREEP